MRPPLRLEYDCDRTRLSPLVHDRFVRLELDAGTHAFLEANQKPHGAIATVAKRALCTFLSDYDANALLKMYPMHVLSTGHWERLRGGTRGGRLLDVGAGMGDVTAAAAPLFDEVVTVETSGAMARRLRQRGFRCEEIDLAEAAPAALEALGTFDVVALLNLLDRCARPITLLDRARARLGPEGRLVVAVPLPLSAHVHAAGHTVDPEELLPPAGGSWESAASLLAERLFGAAGLEIVSLSRVPYLCRGDAGAPLYILDDAVFVAR